MTLYKESQLKRKKKEELVEILNSFGVDGSFSNKGLIKEILKLQKNEY